MNGPFSVGCVIIFTTVEFFNESFSVVGVDILDLYYRIRKLLS